MTTSLEEARIASRCVHIDVLHAQEVVEHFRESVEELDLIEQEEVRLPVGYSAVYKREEAIGIPVNAVAVSVEIHLDDMVGADPRLDEMAFEEGI